MSPMLNIRINTPLDHFPLSMDIEIPGQGITALFGPSGCGKTSLLRCIAGLHRAAQAHIEINGHCWQNSTHFTPPHRRKVGYVFQEASLFEHLSVKQNLLFAHDSNSSDKGALTFEEVSHLLGIQHLIDRMPDTLSGGEKQRVAIGRALLSAPDILLMDEPLSALDFKSKAEILPYLEQLHTRLSIPVVYVTHALSEVESLADHIVLMDRGQVTAQGDIQEIMLDLASPLAHFSKAGSLIDAIVTRYDEHYDLTYLSVDGGALKVPGSQGAIGERKRIRIGANHISLTRFENNDSTIVNTLPVTIAQIDITDKAQCNIILTLGKNTRLLARVTRWSTDQMSLSVGDQLYAQIKGVSLVKY